MATIRVVGLGPGDWSAMPLGTYELLKSGRPVYLRTAVHPVVPRLEAEGVTFLSFDTMYERARQFSELYREIAAALIREAQRHGDVIYAVPGHPLMAEQTVQHLLASASVDVVVGPGQSFLDPSLALVRADPAEGFLLLDGTALHSQQLRPDMHTWIVQVFNRDVASEVKLTLMDVYPDEYAVTVVRAAGVPGEESCRHVALYELDRIEVLDHLTTVFVPRTEDPLILRRDPWFVAGLVERLRAPDGCPWDRSQTHRSLRPYVLEEAYEVADAIDGMDDEGDGEQLVGELGDLYLQVLLHAQIGQEAGAFNLRDVYAALVDKLMRRHPHVFGDRQARDAAEAERLWRTAKASEQGGQLGTGPAGGAPSALDGVKLARPALMAARELQAAAAAVGFDWPDVRGVLAKLREEIDELEHEVAAGDAARAAEELGDLLFAAVNVARWLGADPEAALAHANRKFRSRFLTVEKAVRKTGRDWHAFTPAELDALWAQAKRTVGPGSRNWTAENRADSR
ncbi:MAG: nucleoside triphosphate pyrophosphohydrolase [Alicyclobacillaceae bacterium]|nr:nucleoside triphosphate pyrophosphohydrolase [Alicyclobacillaceae bacterium]